MTTGKNCKKLFSRQRHRPVERPYLLLDGRGQVIVAGHRCCAARHSDRLADLAIRDPFLDMIENFVEEYGPVAGADSADAAGLPFGADKIR
jgi:hypothetical protein